MSSLLASKITNALSDSVTSSSSAQYETISFRPPEKIAALITAINEIFEQPVINLFTDEISQKLCNILLSSKDNESLILDLLDEGPDKGSALWLLINKSAINEIFDPVDIRRIDKNDNVSDPK